MTKNKWIIGALVCLSTAFPIQSVASSQETIAENTQESPRVIAAIINERPIYADQLEPRVQAAIDKYKRFNKGKKPEKLTLQLQILDQFIAGELFYQAGQQHKVADMDKKVAAAIAEQKNNQGEQSKKIDKVAIERQIRMNEYLKEHDLLDPQLPEDELKAFYEKNKANFASTHDKARIKHIIILKKEKEDEKLIKAEAKKAKATLAEARQKILEGKTFAEVAKEYSQDANASNGGDMGYVERGYMPKEIDKIAFSMKLEELSDIIETDKGYHILKVTGKHPKGTIPTYENMRKFLARGFAPEVKSKRVAAHLEQLKDKAKIEILLVKPSEKE